LGTNYYEKYKAETNALATLKVAGEETSDAMEELSAENQKAGDTAKNFAISVRESMSKQKDQVIDLKKSYVKNLGDIKDQFTELAKKHKDTIADITNDLSKLKSEYEESNKSRQDSYKESLADEIKTHQDSLKDKKDELAKMTAFGQEINEVEIANLQKKIAEEQAFLTKHAADAKGVQAELSTDSIDELKNKYAKENSEATKTYNERVAELKKSQEKENESYTTQTSKLSGHLAEIESEYSENLQKIHDDFVEQMSSMMAKMDAPMDKIKEKLEALGDPDVMKVFDEAFPKYQELVKGFTDSATGGLATTAAAAQKCNQSLSQLLSQNSGMSIASPFINGSMANKTSTAEIITQQSSSPGIFSGIGNVLKSGVENIRKLFSFEQGGVVPRTGLIYAHAGEVVVPKGGSNGATVNFYGDTHFNSKEDEDRFVNKIRKVLMQDNDNAKLGIY
jgi:DNA repair exonuclease SbcCD ATPase subunit